MKSFTLDDPLYERDIRLVVGGDEEQLQKYLIATHGPNHKIYNKDEECDEAPDVFNDGCEFSLKTDSHHCFYVWISRPDLQLLHHEIQHLIFDIMNNVGLSYSPDSEEAYTYFGAKIFMQAVRKLWPHSIALE
jgi:hypothetical protein